MVNAEEKHTQDVGRLRTVSAGEEGLCVGEEKSGARGNCGQLE